MSYYTLGTARGKVLKGSKALKIMLQLYTALEKQKAKRRSPRFQVLSFNKVVSVLFYSSGSTSVLLQDCATATQGEMETSDLQLIHI